MENLFYLLNKYDIPNWIVILINILWMFFWWIKGNFAKSRIKGLIVHLRPSIMTIGINKVYQDALQIEFKNNSDSKLILVNPTLGNCQNKFVVSNMAFKDTLTKEYELKFDNEKTFRCEDAMKVLETNSSTFTILPVDTLKKYAGVFDDIKNCSIKKRIFGPEYFVLKYSVIKGRKFSKIKTYY
jgi:hypothetical protein